MEIHCFLFLLFGCGKVHTFVHEFFEPALNLLINIGLNIRHFLDQIFNLKATLPFRINSNLLFLEYSFQFTELMPLLGWLW